MKFLETIQKGPNLSKGYYNLAKIYTYRGEFDKAQSNYDKAQMIDPEIETIEFSRIQNSLIIGDYAKSRQLLRKYSIDHGESTRLDILKSNLEFIDSKVRMKYDLLYQNYLNAFESDSSNITYINELGYFYLRILNDKDALNFINAQFKSPEGKRIKPKSRMKREAKRLFRRAKSFNSKNIQSEIGYWMSRGSEVKPETIESFLNKHYNSSESLTAVGRYFIFKEDYKSSLKYFKKSISSNNQYYKAYVFSLYSNKKLNLEKKNSAIIKKMKSVIPNSSALKYRKEITKYLLIYFL